jgi:hypothetical protein
MSKSSEELAEIRLKLMAAEQVAGLWETAVPSQELPAGMSRGDDTHLAFLTLVYAISGGREPIRLWQDARQLVQDAPDLFDPTYLAYMKPLEIEPPLLHGGMIRKKSEVTVWQRTGLALMMRGKGSVQTILAAHDYAAEKLLAMLQGSKSTFPVLSGAQTAPRWLWGLARDGGQPLQGAAKLPTPVSPAIRRALAALQIETERVSAEIFDFLDVLGRAGCKQQQGKLRCPVATLCPVAAHCQFGS